jgi:hypothetical protein
LKKLCKSLLILFIICSSYPLTTNTVQADIIYKDTRSSIRIDTVTKELKFDTDSKAASTNTRYRTVGWIVRMDPLTPPYDGATCQDDGAMNPYTQCTPMKDNKYVVLRKDEFEQEPPKESDYYIKDGVRRVRSHFKMDGNLLASKFNLNDTLKDVKDHTTLYLSAIFKVVIDDVEQPTEYTTLASIREAKGWLDKTDFRQYYDIPLKYMGPEQPLRKLVLDEKTREPIQKAEDLGTYSTANESVKVKLDKYLAESDLTLSCSYVEKKDENSKTKCTDSGDSPHYVRPNSLLTRNPGIDVGGTDVVALYSKLDCNCSQTAVIPNIKELGGIIESSTINKQTTMQVKFNEKPDSIDKWKKYLENRKDYKIAIQLWRTDKGPNNTGSPPKWASITSNLTPTIGHEEFIYNDISKEKLLNLLAGKSPPTYRDDLTNYPVPAGGKVSFNYNATVKIMTTRKSTGETEVIQADTKTCSGGESLTVTFIRKEKGNYTSSPSYWSEIKEGYPGNETFEAMAGVPTTRNLYFASGGSEFIVDLEVEYVQDTEITRTYKSVFSPTDSEFKLGDQAKTKTVPSPSGASSSTTTVDPHLGGSVTATWTGTLPYTGSVTWGDHWTNVNNKWDYSAYNAAKAQAQAWASAVNGFTISHTAASDGVTRNFNSWGASITSDSKSEPGGSASAGQPQIMGACGTAPNTYSCVKQSYVAASGTNGSDGTYTITVTGSVPARKIDGPSSIYTLPSIEDTWTQKIVFDHMKVNVARVWKLDQAAVNGMIDITGTGEVKATVVAGDPNFFYNRSATNKSVDGRLRYTVETDQHDTVVWDEGPRTNKDDGKGHNGWVGGNAHNSSWATGIIYTNSSYGNTKDYHINSSDSKDKATVEWKKFDERRKTLNTATVVSDMLILQTSSGDQSIMYFEKKSTAKPTQENFDKVSATKEEMWDNNPLSFAKKTPDDINIGSYNGKFSDPANKYSKRTYANVATVFDTMPAGLDRPARPAEAMRLVKAPVDIIDTIPNREYMTGDSKVFYQIMLNYGGGSAPYDVLSNSTFNAVGAEFGSTYSPVHAKINDIVVHNPVSVEKALVVSLDDILDQRTPASKALGGNLQKPEVEYEFILDPNYRQNLLSNGDAEIVNLDNTVAGWNKWVSSGDAANIQFTSRTDDQWVISGDRTFEVSTVANSGTTGGYWLDVPVKPDTTYKFEGDISCHRCQGYFYLDLYNSSGGHESSHTALEGPNDNAGVQHKTVPFTTGPNTSKVRIHLVKGNNMDAASYPRDYLFVDNMKLMNMSVQEFITTEPVYMTQTIPNPDYIPEVKETSEGFGYTGAPQTFTAAAAGTYKLEVWGAEGGYYTTSVSQGGYAAGDVYLNAGDKLGIYVGGKGGNSTSSIDGADSFNNNGGWNGGGSGVGNAGPGGGGATDIRTSASEKALYTWDFNGSLNGFSSGSTAISAPSSALVGYITSTDGYFYSPSVSMIGKPGDMVEITVKNNSTGPSGQIYIYNQNGGYAEGRVVHFTMSTNDASYKTYRVPVGAHSEWNNKSIYSLRFDLANGAGSGTFEVDSIRILTEDNSGSRLIVAGGGGGNSLGTGAISYGGVAASTSTLFNGENGDTSRHVSSYSNDEGGGGGGYYGGKVVHGDDPRASYGGSSWTGTLGSPVMVAGNAAMPAPAGGTQTGQSGNGYARITAPSKPAIGNPTIEINIMAGGGTSDIPSDAYIMVEKESQPNAGADGHNPGDFVLLDYPFQVYFPNTGDFYGNGAYGISGTTPSRGKGFVDNMDTTEWTKSKQMRFAFDVIYDNRMYKANEWIDLPVVEKNFEFYAPLSNKERISALVEFRSLAINGSRDNDTMTNRIRYENLGARHSTLKKFNIDVVGRIGNMVIEDTGDFRFSNLFKQPLETTEWLVPGVVKQVDTSKQNEIIGDLTDIRGKGVSTDTKYLNTYGYTPHLERDPISFPLSPDKNTIPALQRAPLRLGYSVLTDIQTIGNYYEDMQIIPYFYALNLDDGEIQPVDIYMDVDGQYQIINEHGAVVPGWDPTSVYHHIVSLDWTGEEKRRNAAGVEQENTNLVTNYSSITGADEETGKAAQPHDSYYAYGTAQVMYLTGRNRTYVGSPYTYESYNNPGNRISPVQFAQQAQRWHFSYNLPSSAVAIPADSKMNQENIDAIRKNTMVLVLAVDIKAVGDTYVLQYGLPNGYVDIAGTSWSLKGIPHPVVAIYSANKSAADDLDIYGTH